MSVSEVTAVVLLGIGALFTLLAALSVVRLPDVYCRLTATSKAAPFGIALVLLGTALLVGEPSYALQAAAIGAFVAITSPLAAHALARAAHRSGVAATGETRRDVRGPTAHSG